MQAGSFLPTGSQISTQRWIKLRRAAGGPASTPDHKFVLRQNGQVVADLTVDGQQATPVPEDVPVTPNVPVDVEIQRRDETGDWSDPPAAGSAELPDGENFYSKSRDESPDEDYREGNIQISNG